ncbi:MAG: TraM recognition domain-containing protein [Alphaproteobacteria bacterium]|nr:TraM recognition domain-containing protein [Alphaproteobacteria bacterium]
MALRAKYEVKSATLLRDARPWTQRFIDAAKDSETAAMAYVMAALAVALNKDVALFGDLVFFIACCYFWWLVKRPISLPFKLPKSAQRRDPNFKRPDGSLGMSDGILYLGNDSETDEEIWFTNSDARTHCLYLGTTGAGKTFGLKSYACNALCWGSGFIYIDGKADTDLWSTLSAMARRFGRDDDVLIMNYMTGNVSGRVPSNTLNPFSSGSASYLTNMLVSLMPDAEGDNAMWKERAVALVSALMPCLVYKRESQNIPLSISVIRQFLTFKAVIKLARDPSVPEHLRTPVKGYLNELPGYDDNVFDDNGDDKPQGDGSMADTSVPRQQHGYLSMQFTRSMQSLGDDYGFIFDTQAADVDMLDVVLNRRILVVLIPALEKSSDETANLGKIISSTLKGMMGATLGNTVEGDTATAIENKPTNSATPFIAIFDEVGYYTAQGMAVMAAQARSLGFSLVFAGQDLPALEKRVKEEARSITANCNIKLFGKLEDPTQTKDFFEKTVGTALVTEVSGYQRGSGGQGSAGKGYTDSANASVQQRARASYDGLKAFNEGRAIAAFGKSVNEIQLYNSDIGHAKAMRVHRFLPIPPPAEEALESLRMVDSVLRRLRNPKWNAAAQPAPPNRDIDALAQGFAMGKGSGNFVTCGILGVASVAEAHSTIRPEDAAAVNEDGSVTPKPAKIDPVVEQAAAAAVAEATADKGPLNWMQVIGGAEADSSPLRADPPVTEAAAQQQQATAATPPAAPPAQETAAPAEAAAQKPLSWMDVISADSAQQAVAPATPPEQAQQKIQETAQAAALDAPLSWMDVIGGAGATLGPDAVADQRKPPEQRSQPPEGTDEGELGAIEGLSEDILVGVSPGGPMEEPPPAPTQPAQQPAAPPQEAAAQQAPAQQPMQQPPWLPPAPLPAADSGQTPGAPLSWMDVIGAAIEQPDENETDQKQPGEGTDQ